MKRILFLILNVYAILILANTEKKGNIIGRIIDENGFEVFYASVDLLKDGKIVNGAISSEDGTFMIKKSDYGKYSIIIKASGYEDYTTEITLDKRELNLGEIRLKEDSVQLQEARVEVTQVRQEIDKRVVDVGKDLVSAGATAIEILDRVPSLSVDQQTGELSLRGNQNVRIFVDGKPSNIPTSQLLRQLPSNSIKSIEIITNPSAKYNPEGNSGIINIITYKNKRKGYNVNLTAGYRANFRNSYNLGATGNYNTGKFNLFGNYNTNFGESAFFGNINNFDTQINQSVRVEGENKSSHLVKFGFDWFINEKTAFTIYTNQNWFGSDNTNQNTIINRNINRTLIDLAQEEQQNYNQDYSLNFKKDFKKEDHSLEIDGFFSYGYSEKDAAFDWQTAFNTFNLSEFNQKIDGDRENIQLNLDYINSLSEEGKLESGIQYRNEGITNRFLTTQKVEVLDVINFNPPQIISAELPNGFYDFNRNIYSAYTNFGYKWGKLQAQLGIRVENIQENADFISSGGVGIPNNPNEDLVFDDQNIFISNDYTEFYPSAFFTYNLTKRTQVSLNFSRRVDRPSITQLSPIREFQTANVRSVGNPSLQPQFTLNYEVGFLKRFQKGKGSINASIFYRDITDNITRFLEVDDQATSNTVTLLQYTNLGDNESYGLEVSGFYKPLKWWSLNASFDLFNNKLIGPNATPGSNDFIEVDNTAWNGRLSNNFKANKTLSFQIFTMYRGRNNFLQGTQNPMFMFNLGARKTFADGKGSVNVNFNDIFDTFNADIDINNPFIQRGSFNWGQQSFYLGINYSFGGKVKTRADKQKNQTQPNNSGGIGF